MKKGYPSELKVKKLLEKQYGKSKVFKLRDCEDGDFLVHNVALIEVKSTHSKKYYPCKRERTQLLNMTKRAEDLGIGAWLWVHYPNERIIKKEILIEFNDQALSVREILEE